MDGKQFWQKLLINLSSYGDRYWTNGQSICCKTLVVTQLSVGTVETIRTRQCRSRHENYVQLHFDSTLKQTWPVWSTLHILAATPSARHVGQFNTWWEQLTSKQTTRNDSQKQQTYHETIDRRGAHTSQPIQINRQNTTHSFQTYICMHVELLNCTGGVRASPLVLWPQMEAIVPAPDDSC